MVEPYTFKRIPLTGSIVLQSPDKINDVAKRVADSIAWGPTEHVGQTYEEGVKATLDWLTGVTDDDPMATAKGDAP